MLYDKYVFMSKNVIFKLLRKDVVDGKDKKQLLIPSVDFAEFEPTSYEAWRKTVAGLKWCLSKRRT
jgi:hypothetical protein